ncbi:MAG: CesT family type III secretion system chaperone [Pseudomonadota bacterium]
MASARTALAEMVKELSRELGASLDYDEEAGECVLARDDGQEIVVIPDDDADAILLIAPVAPVGTTDREGVLAWLLAENLEENHVGGTSLALDSGNDLVVLRHRVPVSTVDKTALSNMMTNIFGVVDAVAAAMNDRTGGVDFGEETLGDGAPDASGSIRPTDFA